MHTIEVAREGESCYTYHVFLLPGQLLTEQQTVVGSSLSRPGVHLLQKEIKMT